MKSDINIDSFLDQTFLGSDVLAMLDDIEHFIEFSESNLAWQMQRELKRAEREFNEETFENANTEAQCRDQVLGSVQYRFEVSLMQRIRYAGLTALITTIEWCVFDLKKRVSFSIEKKPSDINEAVHILRECCEQVGLNLADEIKALERLIHVRNCIVHSAGLLEIFRHQEQLRTDIMALEGIVLSEDNYLGESIAIESGVLERVIFDVRSWLPSIEKTMLTQGLLDQ